MTIDAAATEAMPVCSKILTSGVRARARTAAAAVGSRKSLVAQAAAPQAMTARMHSDRLALALKA
jgi:hypothetical protein